MAKPADSPAPEAEPVGDIPDSVKATNKNGNKNKIFNRVKRFIEEL
jgi:hypothetical protein